MIDRCCAPARRIQTLAWQMRQLVRRGSAPAEKYSEVPPFLSCFGDESRRCAMQARVKMAHAALQLVRFPRCPAFRVSVLLSPVTLRRAIRGQLASADAGPLSVQELGFALFGHVSAW